MTPTPPSGLREWALSRSRCHQFAASKDGLPVLPSPALWVSLSRLSVCLRGTVSPGLRVTVEPSGSAPRFLRIRDSFSPGTRPLPGSLPDRGILPVSRNARRSGPSPCGNHPRSPRAVVIRSFRLTSLGRFSPSRVLPCPEPHRDCNERGSLSSFRSVLRTGNPVQERAPFGEGLDPVHLSPASSSTYISSRPDPLYLMVVPCIGLPMTERLYSRESTRIGNTRYEPVKFIWAADPALIGVIVRPS